MKSPLKIIIFQTAEPLIIDNDNARPMRAMNLANALIERGHFITLISTDFYHQKKIHRFNRDSKFIVSRNFNLILIKSIGYVHHIGLQRIFDHIQLAYKLNKYFKDEKPNPDVAVIGYPPIEPAWVLSKLLKNRKVITLLDVKDLWPIMFSDKVPALLKPIFNILIFPYTVFARLTAKNVIGITSMSHGYLEFFRNYTKTTNSRNDGIFPLTAPMPERLTLDRKNLIKWWNDKGVYDDSKFKICFIGSLTGSFDFHPIISAAKLFNKSKFDVQFIICGEGVQGSQLVESVQGLENLIFPGWVDFNEISQLAKWCKASIAPYINSQNFSLNITNKVVDYLSFGLPILSPLSGELGGLINKYQVGISYKENDGLSLYEKIIHLLSNDDLRKEMSDNSKQLYHRKFKCSKVYNEFVKHIENCAGRLNE